MRSFRTFVGEIFDNCAVLFFPERWDVSENAKDVVKLKKKNRVRIALFCIGSSG